MFTYLKILFILLISPSMGLSKIKPPDPFSQIETAISQDDLKSLKKNLPLQNIDIKNQKGMTPLHISILQEKEKISKWLIQNKASVHTPTNSGKTPLHIACAKMNFNLVRLLVKKYKANVNVQDSKKRTPLHYLLQKNYLAPSPEDENKKLKIAQFLLKNKANPNVRDASGQHPFSYIAHSGYPKIAKLFIKKKVNLNAVNKSNQNFLIQTIVGAGYFKRKQKYFNHSRVVHLILNQKININSQDHHSYSALHYAVENKLINITQKILHKKPNLNLQTMEGWTALHIAAGKGSLEIVEILIQAGAKVDIKDRSGTPPLYFAIGYGDKKVVSSLLKANALSIVDNQIKGADVFGLNKKQIKTLKELVQKLQKPKK